MQHAMVLEHPFMLATILTTAYFVQSSSHPSATQLTWSMLVYYLWKRLSSGFSWALRVGTAGSVSIYRLISMYNAAGSGLGDVRRSLCWAHGVLCAVLPCERLQCLLCDRQQPIAPARPSGP